MYLKGKHIDVNLINFIEQFPDETSCKLKFKEMRDQVGVTCRHCGSKKHYWQRSIWMYECKHCKTRTTLRSGTVMQASKLPFRYWFIAIHLLTSTKKPFSSLELQRQLGHKYYEPIWYMMQKLRKTMGILDGEYQLDKIVELDEGFFESVDTDQSDQQKQEKRKRGRGSQKQSKVMVMASTIHPLKAPEKHKKRTKFRYVKMIVVDDIRAKTVKPTDIEKVLPWVHTMISNAKRSLIGIHHMISKKYYQDYLDEFCYKVNRRYFGERLFDRLLFACASYNYKDFIHVNR